MMIKLYRIGKVHFHLLGTNDFHVMAREKDLLMWVVLAIAVVIIFLDSLLSLDRRQLKYKLSYNGIPFLYSAFQHRKYPVTKKDRYMLENKVRFINTIVITDGL